MKLYLTLISKVFAFVIVNDIENNAFLAFTFQGIWWGMIIGVFLQTSTLIVLTARTNWDTDVT